MEARTTGRQLSALIRPAGPLPGDWRASAPSLEELLLSCLRNPETPSSADTTTEAAA
ncbi:hypothetical protein GCM10009535_41010 [Streptomyces thermocarboxydovorans]|uniref:Uncharacterized protein n=1 Tax=Streptomyces thermocarboxydovorans TaxID=59298 RepID=A0ABN1HLL3_9ACTN